MSRLDHQWLVASFVSRVIGDPDIRPGSVG